MTILVASPAPVVVATVMSAPLLTLRPEASMASALNVAMPSNMEVEDALRTPCSQRFDCQSASTIHP